MEALGPHNSAVFAVSFMPEISADHLITVTFNDRNVPGKLTHFNMIINIPAHLISMNSNNLICLSLKPQGSPFLSLQADDHHHLEDFQDDFQDDFYLEEQEQNIRAYGSTSTSYGISKREHSRSSRGYYSQQHGIHNKQQPEPLIHNFRKRHPIFLIPNIMDWKQANSGILSFH